MLAVTEGERTVERECLSQIMRQARLRMLKSKHCKLEVRKLRPSCIS